MAELTRALVANHGRGRGEAFGPALLDVAQDHLIGPDATRLDHAGMALKTRLGQRYDELLAAGAALGDEAAIAYARRYAIAGTEPHGDDTPTSDRSGVR